MKPLYYKFIYVIKLASCYIMFVVLLLLVTIKKLICTIFKDLMFLEINIPNEVLRTLMLKLAFLKLL